MKLLTILILLFLPVMTLAAEPPCPPDKVCLENPLVDSKGNDVTNAKVLIGTIIKGVLGVLGSITLLMLVWGGFQWLTSAGSEEKVKSGTQTMIWALVGVVVIFSAYILINTLTNLLSGK
mgnify:CR=1 FL=1